MSKAAHDLAAGPLRLDQDWRVDARSEGGATVHSLRLLHGQRRAPDLPDREELRTLVAEIVREELRSDLGRRMTAAIRSLVRQEVARLFGRISGR